MPTLNQELQYGNCEIGVACAGVDAQRAASISCAEEAARTWKESAQVVFLVFESDSYLNDG